MNNHEIEPNQAKSFYPKTFLAATAMTLTGVFLVSGGSADTFAEEDCQSQANYEKDMFKLCVNDQSVVFDQATFVGSALAAFGAGLGVAAATNAVLEKHTLKKAKEQDDSSYPS